MYIYNDDKGMHIDIVSSSHEDLVRNILRYLNIMTKDKEKRIERMYIRYYDGSIHTIDFHDAISEGVDVDKA